MIQPDDNATYDPKEAQDRFERALRAALNTPPKHRVSPPAKRKGAKAPARASGASAKTAPRRS